MIATIYLKPSGYIEVTNLKSIQSNTENITNFENFLLQSISYTFIGDCIVALTGSEINYIVFNKPKAQ